MSLVAANQPFTDQADLFVGWKAAVVEGCLAFMPTNVDEDSRTTRGALI